MRSRELPKSVRDFIHRYLDSAEQLEVLCLLRTYRDKEWTAQSIAHELRTNVVSTGKRLENLCDNGFLSHRMVNTEKFFKYAPTEILMSQLEEFFRYYPTYRLRVYEAIFSHLDQLSAFSNSFKFNKGEDGDE